MIHVDHDAVIEAFQRIAGPGRICHRGAPAGDPTVGYTHIHGPAHPPGAHRCTNHLVCVEKYNGTVAIARPVGERLGGVERPYTPIASDPLGYSHRDSYGRFTYALDMKAIRNGWDSLDDFANAVVAAFRNSGKAW